MTRRFVLSVLLCTVACQTAAEAENVPRGVPVEVEVLDAGFVQFEGERMAVEFFLLDIRRRVRASWGQPEQLPWVTVVVAEDAPGVDGRWISHLRDELYKAGVRFMNLGRS